MKITTNKLAMRLLLVVALSVIFCVYVNAQPGFPNDPDPDEIPLDPGSWVLLAAGVGYGVKKWKDAKAAKTELKEMSDLEDENKINRNF